MTPLNESATESAPVTTTVGPGTGWGAPVRSTALDAVNTVIACLAVLGNGLVIAVMLLRRRLFSSFTNRLILHQSTIDSVAGVVFFGHQVLKSSDLRASVTGTSARDQLLCRVLSSDSLLWCMNVTSTYNLVVISLERFVATCHPVRHRNSWWGTGPGAAKARWATLAACLVGFSYGSHTMLFHEAHGGRCRQIPMDAGLKALHGLITVGVEYAIPVLIMVYTYTRIVLMLARRKKNDQQQRAQRAMSTAKRNVLVTTLLIGLMFVICWTPIEIFAVDPDLFGQSAALYKVFTTLVGCNLFVNPLIYCFKYEHFRSQLKGLLMSRCRPNQVHDVGSFSVDSTVVRT